MKSRAPLWIAIGVVLIAGAVGLYFGLSQGSKTPSVSPVPASVLARDAGQVEIAQPELDIVEEEEEEEEEPPPPGRPRRSPQERLREVARSGSGSRRLQKWLDSASIRRLAAAVRLIAQGRSPRPVVGFIEVPGRFSVVDSWDQAARRAGRLPPGLPENETEAIFVSPESYARYDAVTRVFTSADAAAWGRGYRQVRPYFQRVFREVAEPSERFDDVLVEALDRLLQVEVPPGQAELIERGAVFLFKDPQLEALSDAEKHLLRMGSKNAAAMQSFLRRFARSAGLRVAAGR